MKYITVDNYRDFKPSEFVRSFKGDIETAQKLGMPMDMGSFTEKDALNGCLPCLGGMALINWNIDINSDIGEAIAMVGNAIRLDSVTSFLAHLNLLYPGVKKIKLFYSGQLFFDSVSDYKKLKSAVDFYADQLENAGI